MLSYVDDIPHTSIPVSTLYVLSNHNYRLLTTRQSASQLPTASYPGNDMSSEPVLTCNIESNYTHDNDFDFAPTSTDPYAVVYKSPDWSEFGIGA